MNTYIFFRNDGFYPLDLADDQAAKENAELNPGTLRVETPERKVIWADNNALLGQPPIGTELFRRMNDDTPDRFKKINLESWSPTPFVVDVFTTDREQEIQSWCNHHFGRESSPMHERAGSWHQSHVTLHGYCWYGFATEPMMRRFLAQFPSPPRVSAKPAV